MEYKTRTQDVIERLQEGQFKQFDEDELYKLKSLQHRATQYVMYYTKVIKIEKPKLILNIFLVREIPT